MKNGLRENYAHIIMLVSYYILLFRMPKKCFIYLCHRNKWPRSSDVNKKEETNTIACRK